MRVLVKINGVDQVDEIFENEIVSPGTMRLYTCGELMDIIVQDISDIDLYAINRQLLEQGYADLSKYHAEYCEDNDEE